MSRKIFKLAAVGFAVVLVASIAVGANNAGKPVPSTDGDSVVQVSPSPAPGPAPSTGTSQTAPQRNAVAKAKGYIGLMGFSKSGLAEQLEFDGFSAADATYAAANCGANYTEEADEKAADYQGLMPFSASGLLDQLKFDGFTAAQAAHGVASVGL